MVMTGCLKLVAWSMVSYHDTMIPDEVIYNLKMVLWTPNNVQNIVVINNLQPKPVVLTIM